MAYTDRKQRQIGRLRQLLEVAIETKNVNGGIQISKLIMSLEGWNIPVSKDDVPELPTPSTDLSALLEHLNEPEAGKTNG